MKVYFLGTGTSQGIPVIGSNHSVCKSKDAKDKRLRVSVWIYDENYSFVIDCGPDFRQQMLTSGCTKLDSILFTHEHADHTAGLDDIRPFFFKQGDIPIYAHKRVIENLKKRFDYIFEIENKYPGAPEVKKNIITKNVPFQWGEKYILPIEVMHGSLPVLAFRFGSLAYVTDVNYISPASMRQLEDLDYLILGVLQPHSHYSHFNVEEGLQVIETLKPKQAKSFNSSRVIGPVVSWLPTVVIFGSQ